MLQNYTYINVLQQIRISLNQTRNSQTLLILRGFQFEVSAILHLDISTNNIEPE